MYGGVMDWRIGIERGARDRQMWRDIMLSCHSVDVNVFHDMGNMAEKLYQDNDDWPAWP